MRPEHTGACRPGGAECRRCSRGPGSPLHLCCRRQRGDGRETRDIPGPFLYFTVFLTAACRTRYLILSCFSRSTLLFPLVLSSLSVRTFGRSTPPCHTFLRVPSERPCVSLLAFRSTALPGTARTWGSFDRKGAGQETTARRSSECRPFPGEGPLSYESSLAFCRASRQRRAHWAQLRIFSQRTRAHRCPPAGAPFARTQALCVFKIRYFHGARALLHKFKPVLPQLPCDSLSSAVGVAR